MRVEHGQLNILRSTAGYELSDDKLVGRQLGAWSSVAISITQTVRIDESELVAPAQG